MTYFHGTKAQLKPGDLIVAGHASNYGGRRPSVHVYFAGAMEAAIWGAELARGEEPGRIFIVEPTGAFVDDPNLTDKKFPGNPTKSYRTREALKVVGEVTDWQGHSPEQLRTMREHLAELERLGVEAIDD